MKQVIILLMIMMGWASWTYAQPGDHKKDVSSSSEVESTSVKYDYDPPYAYVSSKYMDSLDKLRKIFGYKGSQTNEELARNTTKSLPFSKIQVIVDEDANIIDCTLLESTNPGKDNTVMGFLKGERYFDVPGMLNGKPCKSIAIFKFRYYQNGDFNGGCNTFFPVIPLPDSETASTDSAASN